MQFDGVFNTAYYTNHKASITARYTNNASDIFMINLKQLLTHRKYVVDEVMETISDESKHHYIFTHSLTNCTLHLFIYNTNKTGITSIRENLTTLKEAPQNITEVIFISKTTLTPQAKCELASFARRKQKTRPRFNIQQFLISEIMLNVSKHRLQPRSSRLLSPDEVLTILKSRNLTKQQLPRTYTHDALIKYNGWIAGDVIEHIRVKGGTTYPEIMIRRVID